MPSPFPGMNPYSEQAARWLDFQTVYRTAMRSQLAPQFGPRFIVQLEEHIYIHDLPIGPQLPALTVAPALDLAPAPARGASPPLAPAPVSVLLCLHTGMVNRVKDSLTEMRALEKRQIESKERSSSKSKSKSRSRSRSRVKSKTRRDAALLRGESALAVNVPVPYGRSLPPPPATSTWPRRCGGPSERSRSRV
jgi:hypothetical protein